MRSRRSHECEHKELLTTVWLIDSPIARNPLRGNSQGVPCFILLSWHSWRPSGELSPQVTEGVFCYLSRNSLLARCARFVKNFREETRYRALTRSFSRSFHQTTSRKDSANCVRLWKSVVFQRAEKNPSPPYGRSSPARGAKRRASVVIPTTEQREGGVYPLVQQRTRGFSPPFGGRNDRKNDGTF